MRLFAVAWSVLFAAYGQGTAQGDMENSYQSLQKAVKDNDAAQVKKLAAETFVAARAIIASPAPQADADKETWTKDVAYAKDVESNTESALYSVAIQARPEEAVGLCVLLEQTTPKSKYLDQGYGFYFQCLQKTGGSGEIAGITFKGLAQFSAHQKFLIGVA